MLPALDDNEVRILGSLIEKSIVTPDLYPLTLNALTNACNQKSARNPVMSLQPGEVQHAIRVLEAKHLVRTEENFKSRAEKYAQRFCNTRYSDLHFDPAELAVVCLLMLRGPQTPGELRSRSGRLHEFGDNAAVVETLKSLAQRDAEPLVIELPRTPGRKDPEYMHLFAGPVDIKAYQSQAQSAKAASPTSRVSVADLADRLDRLEAEVAELKNRLR
ncbi:MAG: YceH family protein [Woeseiaceae bacterium]